MEQETDTAQDQVQFQLGSGQVKQHQGPSQMVKLSEEQKEEQKEIQKEAKQWN